jgi:hypothetical protein
MIHNVRVIGRRSSRAVSRSASVALRVENPSAERLIIAPSPLPAAIGGLAIGVVSFPCPNSLEAADYGTAIRSLASFGGSRRQTEAIFPDV